MSPPDSRSTIIFFHQGFSPYLPFVLEQARISNPRARVILLGDARNRIAGIDYEHRICPETSPRRQRFHRVFVHLNTSHLEDERRCIERWLILADFLEREAVGPFWFLDSDAFPLTDLGQMAQAAGGGYAGLPHFFIACFCPEDRAARRFADWILREYEEPDRLRRWQEKFEKFRLGQPGGAVVHDMALSVAFEKEEGLSLRDLHQPCGPWIFDGGEWGGAFLQKTQVPQHGRGREDGIIRVRHNGQTHQLAMLHMQGSDKSHVPGLTPWRAAIVRAFFRPPWYRNLRFLLKYWRNGARYRKYLDSKS